MIITNILHVTGTKADLFSASYFKKEEGKRVAINPFSWVDGRLYGYGMVQEMFGPVRICIDLRAAKEACGFTGEGDDPMEQINNCVPDDSAMEHIALNYKVVNPPVPPATSYKTWQYKFMTYEHQFSKWEQTGKYGEWVATTLVETRWVKGKTEIVPRKTTDETAQVFKSYYYLNKYDIDPRHFVDVPLEIGANIEAKERELEDHFRKVYPDWDKDHPDDKMDLKLYEVDIREADKVSTDTDHDQYLMGYWLGYYDAYPKMISVDDESKVIASYGHWTEPNMEGDFEYRHSLPDAVFDFKKEIVNRKTTLPICNGICCYPRIVDEKIYANQGQRLSYNKQDRNRRWVLVDFEPVGGCIFHQLKDLHGNLTELILPDYDHTKQSLLLVVKGRLFTPDEFEVLNNKRLLFDITKYTVANEIDTMICRGDFVNNTVVIQKKKTEYDLRDDENSFLIVINKPNLQVVRHKCFGGSWPITKMPWGSDSHAGSVKCDFDQPARGLLFDESTRSVLDYTREIQTMTFYADKMRRWGISSTTSNWQSLLAISDESSDNLMSARGFIVDDVHTDLYDHVIWPRLSILDFVFRG